MGSIVELDTYRNYVDVPKIAESRRILFFQEISEKNNTGNFTPDTVSTEFFDLYRNRGVTSDLILDGFFFLKREQLRADGSNMVNFIADFAKAAVDQRVWEQTGDLTLNFESERFVKLYDTVVHNLASLVTEHPLADITKVETRQEQWDRFGNELRLRCFGNYLEEILEDAVVSSQTLPFERSRFAANWSNYFEKLKPGRQQGDSRTFVEFSPSPPLTAEAKTRGYTGKDTIFFLEFDSVTQTEHMTQRWLMTDISSYLQLLRNIGMTVPDMFDHADIMHLSNFFSAEQVEKIHTFIDIHHGVISKHKPAIETYKKNEFEPALARQVYAILSRGAKKLVDGEDIALEAELLSATLALAQEKFKAEIAAIAGITSQSSSVLRSLSQEEWQRLQTDDIYRMEFVKKNNIVLTGCGTNTEKKSSLAEIFSSSEKNYSFDTKGTCQKCKSEKMLGPCGLCETCDDTLRDAEINEKLIQFLTNQNSGQDYDIMNPYANAA